MSAANRLVPVSALFAVLVLAGCTGENPSEPTSPASGTPTPTATPTAPTGSPTVNDACVPTPLIELDSIPDDPSLNDDDDDTIAIFEVDGHALIGKHVDDEEAARNGLKLWQEFTTRVPANQLADLVQFEISLDEDPVAYFNRTGNVTTSRDGLKIGYSVASFEQNDPNPCAPLDKHRGSFDWSLVHEFGHLRGWVDGSWDAFEDTFPNVAASGDGFPDDGSPVLTGDFVTSYAARADGDEDHAETWTTFIMLDDDAIPPFSEGEPLALTKVRWMSEQPGYVALRNAIRISEPGVVPGPVDAAPRLQARPEGPRFSTPSWMHALYQESPTDGQQVEFFGDDIILSTLVDGVETERLSLKETEDTTGVFYFERHDGGAALSYSFMAADGDLRHNHDFVYLDPETLRFSGETYDPSTNDLQPFEAVELTRVELP